MITHIRPGKRGTHVTVVDQWTANPGKLDELSAIYGQVTEQMQASEPGAQAVHVYVSEAENALYVRGEFALHSAGFDR